MTNQKVDIKMLASDVFLTGLIGGVVVQAILCVILSFSIKWGLNEILASIIIGVVLFGYHINNIRDVFFMHKGNGFIPMVLKLCAVLIIIIFVLAYNDYLYDLRIVDFNILNIMRQA